MGTTDYVRYETDHEGERMPIQVHVGFTGLSSEEPVSYTHLDVYKRQNDPKLIRNLLEIKSQNKEKLVNFIKEYEGIELDSSFVFDVQIKRLHAVSYTHLDVYKRQGSRKKTIAIVPYFTDKSEYD